MNFLCIFTVKGHIQTARSRSLYFQAKKKSEAPPPRRKPKKVIIPRREPSIVVPPRVPVYITPDKTVCVECPCFPPEDPYAKNKKLNPCQKSPRTLYELSAEVVDRLGFPPALDWSENEVADWLATEVGFPEYKDCILDNHINGSRLLMLEDSFALTEINVKNFDHIKVLLPATAEQTGGCGESWRILSQQLTEYY
ncbi:hypothetical protein KGM_201632 [Danaus plexippus plexippus]|uniref:SAM domain-containing protein n=1 Tax=Danaus plexippus plexippus TaxID=278856 RepID=A0A212F0S2_DANPL|nr:hypothetical protein KGM_201632 [Danaus plexippus plexippus]